MDKSSNHINPKPTFLDLLVLAIQVRKESKELKEIGKQFCKFIKTK